MHNIMSSDMSINKAFWVVLPHEGNAMLFTNDFIFKCSAYDILKSVGLPMNDAFCWRHNATSIQSSAMSSESVLFNQQRLPTSKQKVCTLHSFAHSHCISIIAQPGFPRRSASEYCEPLRGSSGACKYNNKEMWNRQHVECRSICCVWPLYAFRTILHWWQRTTNNKSVIIHKIHVCTEAFSTETKLSTKHRFYKSQNVPSLFFANKPFAYFSTSLVRLECKLLLGSIDPHARCLTLVSCRHLCTSLLHLDKGDEVTSLERIFITPRPMANTAYSVNHNRCNKAACCTAQTFICTQTRITYSRRALGSFWIWSRIIFMAGSLMMRPTSGSFIALFCTSSGLLRFWYSF